ncbi:MAG: cell division topological specificity factor MinE [Nitrospirae bacterium]|uniref:cell division topological specificity factor MinE n=1 Tax=Candidatus Magnetobacterium casense TaxID=1455061 RepID=UPI00058D33BB|nr:cell division topological specificity factor MinE [Candidatus Magnetobacterium casensis]MBF0337895.1 cell division topological specificity factor MinE [Nitrospirota bacterium]
MSLLAYFRKGCSSDTAKERLTMVLSYERQGLPPNFSELLQRDIASIFAKYQQFDVKSIEVLIRKVNNSDEVMISIPLSKRAKGLQ